ncbi:hypothetical protein HNQ69_001307 [Bartonella callosciuri]|uniref:Uncharacterized protein n=1 Tax=Bartonella callosciuri TaxID=686223 RepID=A0A840NQP1_9HYPH|nr:hypothetical protein [Bartonella callosciuri]
MRIFQKGRSQKETLENLSGRSGGVPNTSFIL